MQFPEVPKVNLMPRQRQPGDYILLSLLYAHMNADAAEDGNTNNVAGRKITLDPDGNAFFPQRSELNH